MIQLNTLLRISLILLTSIALTSSTGCSQRQRLLNVDALSEVPSGAVPAPAGNKLCQWQHAQVQQAAQDQTVLYKADFVGLSPQLSPSATDKIVQALRTGTASSQFWKVEPTGDSFRDANRVNSVAQQLAYWGVSNPQVGIGIPTALGLPGVIAESNFRNSVNSQRNTNTNSQNQFGGLGANRF